VTNETAQFQVINFLHSFIILLFYFIFQKVDFRYSDTTDWIYKGLEFGLDLDTRLALVGPNGAGKSTLLKLIYGDVNRFLFSYYL